jgi:hypothetical protein
MSEPLLVVDNLAVDFHQGAAVTHAVNGVSSRSTRARPWHWSANPAPANR